MSSVVVFRQQYSVTGLNSQLHADGHHSLVTWGFVIHGANRWVSQIHCLPGILNKQKKHTVTKLFFGSFHVKSSKVSKTCNHHVSKVNPDLHIFNTLTKYGQTQNFTLISQSSQFRKKF